VCVEISGLACDHGDSRWSYCKLVAGLLRDVGVVKCHLGEMAAGCQLLHEAASLYQWMPQSEDVQPAVDDIIKVAEVFDRRRSPHRFQLNTVHSNCQRLESMFFIYLFDFCLFAAQLPSRS